jgi:hypothetical protein
MMMMAKIVVNTSMRLGFKNERLKNFDTTKVARAALRDIISMVPSVTGLF